MYEQTVYLQNLCTEIFYSRSISCYWGICLFKMVSVALSGTNGPDICIYSGRTSLNMCSVLMCLVLFKCVWNLSCKVALADFINLTGGLDGISSCSIS